MDESCPSGVVREYSDVERGAPVFFGVVTKIEIRIHSLGITHFPPTAFVLFSSNQPYVTETPNI